MLDTDGCPQYRDRSGAGGAIDRYTATTISMIHPLGVRDAEMNWNFRTLLRLFMLVGGAILSVYGIADGNTLYVLIGLAGVVMGSIGLAYEYREQRSN